MATLQIPRKDANIQQPRTGSVQVYSCTAVQLNNCTTVYLYKCTLSITGARGCAAVATVHCACNRSGDSLREKSGRSVNHNRPNRKTVQAGFGCVRPCPVASEESMPGDGTVAGLIASGG